MWKKALIAVGVIAAIVLVPVVVLFGWIVAAAVASGWEPDDVGFRDELVWRASLEGLGLAALRSAPVRVVSFRAGQERSGAMGTSFGVAAPDGRHLLIHARRLFSEGPASTFGLEPIPISDVELRAVAGPNFTPFVASDLRTIALIRDGSVAVVRRENGRLTVVPVRDSRANAAGEVSWGPGGREFTFSLGGKVYIYSLEEGVSRELVAGFDPAWSPDGVWIAFRSNDGEALIVPATGDAGSRRLMAGVRVFGGFKWSPDGQYLLYSREYAIKAPLGSLGYTGIYRMKDGARCKAVGHSFKGMGSAAGWDWVYSSELAGN